MSVATQELQSFYEFAGQRLRDVDRARTLDELYMEWRATNPTSEELDSNVLAVRAALRDMDKGNIGRPFGEFAAEFRQRNGM